MQMLFDASDKIEAILAAVSYHVSLRPGAWAYTPQISSTSGCYDKALLPDPTANDGDSRACFADSWPRMLVAKENPFLREEALHTLHAVRRPHYVTGPPLQQRERHCSVTRRCFSPHAHTWSACKRGQSGMLVSLHRPESRGCACPGASVSMREEMQRCTNMPAIKKHAACTYDPDIRTDTHTHHRTAHHAPLSTLLS